jgi:hypothetical protein
MPGANPGAISIILSAPTGKAAHNIGGATLHSVFRLPVSQCQADMPKLSEDIANQMSAGLCDTKLIVIDEVSMVGHRQFLRVDRRMKQIFKSYEPSGGVSVLCVGDFQQLKPVGDNYVFSSGRMNSLYDLRPSLWENFRIFELTEIMRQRDDQPFAVTLNNMAFGSMTDEDIRLVKECQVKNERDVPRSTLRLFKSNAEVGTYNNKILDLTLGQGWIAKAIDVCFGDISEDQKNEVINRIA